jgi:hypothetical protein
VVVVQKQQSSSQAFLLVFICEHSWNPSGTIFFVSELNCDSLIEDRSQNIWENFMKLISERELQPCLSNPW